jgi:dCMP deaminase
VGVDERGMSEEINEAAWLGRPDRNLYYLGLAIAVSARSECKGLKVGAVLVRDNRVVSTGYNSTPEGWDNCSEGGACPRCDNRNAFGSGNGYDKCVCVHAEMNAIAAAARYGMAVDSASAYVTHEPCLTCAKELTQAGVRQVFFALPVPAFREGDHGVRRHLEETRTRFLGQLHARRISPKEVVEALETATRHFHANAESGV